MTNKDYYNVLGIAEDASHAEIKKAYRKRALKYHPDKNQGDKKAEEKFKEVSEAYYALGDEKRRKEYDNLRKMGAYTGDFSSSQGFDYSDFSSHFQGGQGDGFSSSSIFGDIFGDLFSGAARGRSGGGQTYYYSAGSPSGGRNQNVNTDIKANLPVPKTLAQKGGEAKFKLSTGKSITLKVPSGIKNGQKMRLKGQGEKCPCCRHKGDLIVSIQIK